MLQPSISSPLPQSPPPGLRFGFPRVYLVAQLRARLERLLGAGACQVGHLDRQGEFVAVAADDDFDGPEFALRLRPDPRGAIARAHVVALQVSILYGRYHLQVLGHEFEIAFLPVLDDTRLTTAARRIVHTLEGVARVR
ncbi:hypothetical protein [Herbaspirillum sp. YR522]|uniref:hypothetical protein n=1 Tax=Herbaspirillum sp. YR522 TaxID=1144342 RepID=UPI00026F4B3B|nr:hypothetical protein [Herbaspirillum sp. YR522]EJM95583.1 hypothetical protein PMI40_04972 [Herbaspirillum sp. YR522]